MRRREFIALVTGAVAIAWPLESNAQQVATQSIGWLSLRTPDTDEEVSNLAAFRQGLKETGYVEGKNVAIEFRHGGGQYDLMPALAADLVQNQVSVIVTSGGAAVTRIAQQATTTIPIVFASSSDPVPDIVTRINRPGANTTGVYLLNVALAPRRLEILRELIPKARKIAFLMNPESMTFSAQTADIEKAARALGVELNVVRASTEAEISAAFASLAQNGCDALLMGSDPFFQVRRDQIIELAARDGIPAMYEWSEFVKSGGLISYSTDRAEMWRQMGIYVTRILNGARPGELPVMQATKFDLIINLKTATALGIIVPPTLLARADEVIE